MPNVFFTADTHCGHDNIIRYCNRPFSGPDEMLEVMVERANAVLRKGDVLYHLGDVAWSTFKWEDYFHRLNTQEIHLIMGNHDDPKKARAAKWLRSVADIKMIHVGSYHVAMCHYAMKSWPSRSHGALHCFGHSHGKLKGDGRSMDVGVDCWGYAPISLEEVADKLKDIPIWEGRKEGECIE